jgi:tetratricopeptide (TPR) repeat protein
MTSSPPIDWVTSLAVLGAGLVLGALVLFRLLSKGRQAAQTLDEPPALDLEARRDELLQQLRDLEDTGAKRTPAQLARERYGLELEAARALRELEAQRAAAARPARKKKGAESPEAEAGWLARNPSLKGFVWGAGSVVILGLMLLFVSRSAEERVAGSSATGGQTPGASSGMADAEEAEIRAWLDQHPDDVEAHLALTRVLLTRQDLMGVWNETKKVLELQPGEPHGLTYQSLVRLAMGQPDVALEMLDQALRVDPDLFDAHVHRSLVLLRLGRRDEARANIEAAEQRFPDQKDVLESLWQEMSSSPVDEAAPPTGEENPHAALRPDRTPEAMAEPVPAANPADAGQELSGVVELDPALAGQVAPGTVVFITVREKGAEGPPVAVSRMVATSFPLPFRIGPAQSMMGEPIPEHAHIEVRADADGDAGTRDPNDPHASLDDVPAGSSGLRLVLRR